MTSQPANTRFASQPDARIDQVLTALRTTEPPTGLEQRIAARLAQAAETRTLSASPTIAESSYFAVILNAVKDPCISLAPARRYSVATAALTVILALTTMTLLHHRTPFTTARTAPVVAPSSSATTKAAVLPSSNSTLERAGFQSRHNAPAPISPSAAEEIPAVAAATQAPRGFSLRSHSPLQVPRGFSLGSHSPQNAAGVLTPASAQDLDQIALAETLAPSHPAPPLPLTAQEHMMLAATRPGQPIQLAELDLARAPNLRAAAKAREEASIDRYVKGLLSPFATADALSPTTDSQPQEASTPPPPPSK